MNIAKTIDEWMHLHFAKRVFVATVTGTSGNKVFIRRNGQGGPDISAYPKLASYTTPVAGDIVEVIQVGETPVVQGRIST